MVNPSPYFGHDSLTLALIPSMVVRITLWKQWPPIAGTLLLIIAIVYLPHLESIQYVPSLPLEGSELNDLHLTRSLVTEKSEIDLYSKERNNSILWFLIICIWYGS